MKAKKMKCWQVKDCGREIAKDCEAIITHHEHSCWRVAGTMCGGKPQGTFAQKMSTCKACNYYEYMNGVSGVSDM